MTAPYAAAPPPVPGGLRRAVVALGSNLGDRMDALQEAVDLLGDTPSCHVAAVSPVYETDPVGGPEQPKYLNAVLLLDTALAPNQVLDRCVAVEDSLGRLREERWGPRTLDADLIDYEGHTAADPQLTLPHPRAHERGFVLAPWYDIDANAELAGRGRVAALLEVTGRAGVVRRDDLELRMPE